MSIEMGITMVWLAWKWTKDQTEGEENLTASCEHSILLAKDQPMQPIPEEIPIAYDAEYSAKIAYESVENLDIRVVSAVETIETIAATVDSIETVAELLQAKTAIEAAASFVEESAKTAMAAAEIAVTPPVTAVPAIAAPPAAVATRTFFLFMPHFCIQDSALTKSERIGSDDKVSSSRQLILQESETEHDLGI